MGVVLLLFIMVGWGGSLDLDEVEYVSYLPDRLYGADFKGLNWRTSDYVWERDNTYTIMRDTYKFNLIRRHFAGEPVYNNDENYMSRLERCASLARDRGMWVIFDLYSWNLGTDASIRRQQEHNWDPNDSTWGDARWNQLWTNMGNRFKGYGNVILELGNEPDDYNNTGWTAAMYERQRARYAATITLLRGLGFANYIGIPGTGYGTTLSNWPSRVASLGDSLLLFDIHYYIEYQGGGTAQSSIRSYMNARGCDDLMALGYRVLVGEFGVKGREDQQTETQRVWFRNFLFVQRDDGYDTCFQSFQPGTDFPGIQGDWGDSYWPSRTPTTPMTWFTTGFVYNNAVYTPPTLQYYTDLPLDDGTLTVTAAYQNGTTIAANGQVWSQGTGSSSYLGVSSYPRNDAGTYSTAIIDDIITVMNQENLSIYRMSIWYTVADSTRDAMIQYFFDNCNYDLIVCYHDYPAGAMRPDWSTARAWVLDLIATFSDYESRLWVEFANERTDADLATQAQVIVSAVRNAGYTDVKLICNKWNQTWSSMAGITDPQDQFYTGYHYYFNSWSVAGATTDNAGGIQAAMSAGIPGTRLFNTEIGADSNEEGSFSESEVGEVNAFMQWCADRNISNTVWQRYGLQNWDTYQSMNLTFPVTATRQLIYQGPTPFTRTIYAGVYAVDVTWANTTQTRITSVTANSATVEAFTFPNPTPPPTQDQYTVQLLSSTGGYTVPGAGVYVYLVSQLFSATAYAAADYTFSRWLRDGGEWGTTRTIAFNGTPNVTYTVQPDFTAVPGEPEDPPPPNLPPPVDPPPQTTPPAPGTGYRIPATLPDPALPVGDNALFTLFLRRLTKSAPPELDAVAHQLAMTEPLSFSALVTLLKRRKISI
jgi:hypothetical protein